MNTIRLDGEQLLWNGRASSEADVREFLAIIANDMNPRPLTVLSYSARTSGKRVQRIRALVHAIVQCKPGDCLEVTS